MAAFVKFSRGLTATYERLRVKDPDTLYLVYDSIDADEGRLYLGDKLISSVIDTSNLELSSLSDVDINVPLEDGMLLQYNNSTLGGKWTAVPLSDISIPSGTGSNISIEDDLEDISDPQPNDIAVVDGQAYIYNGDTWINFIDSELREEIENNYYTKDEIDDILDGYTPAEYINSVDENVFHVEAGQLQLVSVPNEALDLSDYITRDEVGDLNELVDRASENSTLIEEINYIKSMLQWHDIEEETI